MSGLNDLPRTIRFIRVGCDRSENLDAAAASAVAAFVSENQVPDDVPIVVMLDQTKLPYEESYICTTDWREVVDAIRSLAVRGAPAIGIAGAAAVALRASELLYAGRCGLLWDTSGPGCSFATDGGGFDPDLYREEMESAACVIAGARPTAVNLQREVGEALAVASSGLDAGMGPSDVLDALHDHVRSLIDADEAACRRIGELGADLLPQDSCVLTHCNAGSLATSFYGTALGVIYAAFEQGKIRRVFSDETRPVGQGARLTAWELSKVGVPTTLICDDMAAYVMSSCNVDAVVVGADRIAANGDVANKIGTLGVAILAKHFGIPFYVTAPSSTFDPATSSGADIVIEQRDAREVLERPIIGVDVLNPAFDVTPAELVSAIITERGIFPPDDLSSLQELL